MKRDVETHETAYTKRHDNSPCDSPSASCSSSRGPHADQRISVREKPIFAPLHLVVSIDLTFHPGYYPHMPIAMLGIYRFTVSVLCLSVRKMFVSDTSGVLRRRAIKFGRVIDLGGRQVIFPFGELWPRVSAVQGQRSTSKFLTRDISKTLTDTMLDLRQHLYVGHTGSRLAPSDLTLDDVDSQTSR